MRPIAAVPRWLILLAILCAVAPLVVQGASLSHTHERGNPGLYNQEHDFTLYAVSSAAVLPDTVAAIVALVLAISVCITAPPRPTSIAYAAADCRAPPAR